MNNKNIKNNIIKKSFIKSIPVLIGYIFLGMSYGIYSVSKGINIFIPIITSIFIYAGSMEFVLANLLVQAFNPLHAILLTLMINARHIFYSLSMMPYYNDYNPNIKHYKIRKFLLIFGLTDETFSVSYMLNDVKDINERDQMLFYISIFDHFYWILGVTIGTLFASLITFNTTGIDFVMTALFVIILINQFKTCKSKLPGIIGISVTLICLFVFGKDIFLIPSLILILVLLFVLRHPIERKIKGE